jgi:hypothetical protein
LAAVDPLKTFVQSAGTAGRYCKQTYMCGSKIPYLLADQAVSTSSLAPASVKNLEKFDQIQVQFSE